MNHSPLTIRTDQLLRESAGLLDCRLSDHQVEQFITYLEEIKSWNRRINLTSIESPEDIVLKHFIDSLTCLKAVSLSEGLKVLDLGTGAGFPGIPLAIYQPQIDLTLLDSMRKRAEFLKHLKCVLGLPEIKILCGRAEEYGRDRTEREQYKLILSRAVSNLSVLAELALPFLRVGGEFLAMKGKEVREEIEAARETIALLGGRLKEVTEIILPMIDQKRHLVLINKEKETPDRYPRRPGIPQKRPITVIAQ
ncbi:MAG: 16S rRNA (guanine(527)-N(7))-methyltransferase RsmG [bacterium]|nr:16S rRNA (guanine(527)-N(7))-methyltransferase RsmG [bacterium]